MMDDYEDQRSSRSQKASEISSKVKNDPLLIGQSSEGMLGKAAMIITNEKEAIETDSIDDEEDFVDEKKSDETNETDIFLTKFCSEGGQTYRLCPEKWTINDQGFGIDVTCCGGECQPKSFNDIQKEVKRTTEGLQTQMSNREIFFRWAVQVNRQRSHSDLSLNEIP